MFIDSSIKWEVDFVVGVLSTEANSLKLRLKLFVAQYRARTIPIATTHISKTART